MFETSNDIECLEKINTDWDNIRKLTYGLNLLVQRDITEIL